MEPKCPSSALLRQVPPNLILHHTRGAEILREAWPTWAGDAPMGPKKSHPLSWDIPTSQVYAAFSCQWKLEPLQALLLAPFLEKNQDAGLSQKVTTAAMFETKPG